MIRKGLKPRIAIGFDLVGRDPGMRQVLPFRRSWAAIAVLAVMDAIFLFPALAALHQARSEWSSFDSLFDLVGALFLSGWLVGWSIAPLGMTAVLVLMLFGREVVKARAGQVEIFAGLPLLGVAARYDADHMRNLRLERPEPKSGKSWRGPHLAFDYGANTVAFGSNIDAVEAARLEENMQAATGMKVRHGEARPAELETTWDADAPTVAAAAEPRAAPVDAKSTSVAMLIIANLVPVAGAVFFGWRLSDVMVLYWAESGVIGFFNLCKMAVIGHWLALPAGLFFIGHFGAFMAVHFLFIYTLFVEGLSAGGKPGGDLSQVAHLFTSLWPALAALFISHGYSFFSNFLARKEYLGRSLKTQMGEPYNRIVFMQLALIFGGWLVMLLGQPGPVLLLVIAIKVYFDFKAHLKQHN